jgi:hypothetical protein
MGRKQPAKRKGKAGKKLNSIIAPPMPIEAAINAEPFGATDTSACATLGSAIEREWHVAERALETLSAHTVAQVAKVIPPGKAALVTAFADFFAELKAQLTTRLAGNGEAPVAGSDYSIPDDLSIPHCLQRGVS